MTSKFPVRIKDFAIIMGWAVITASIILQAIYKPRYGVVVASPVPLTSLDYLLLFAASIFAGIVLLDAQKVMLGYIVSFFISLLIMFVALISPTLIGTVRYGTIGGLLYGGAVVLIFQSVFPAAIFVCFAGGVLGGIFGERLRL